MRGTAPLLGRKEEVDYMMKRLLTSIIIALLGGGLLTACSRAHRSEYHGVTYKMNFGRQIINPDAPAEEELPASSGAIGEEIYKRHADTYKQAIPERLRGVTIQGGIKSQ
jgi:ABC-type oligopeptide transport system substrate-binding subunit